MGSGQICPINNMHESDDGYYVLYADYESLQAMFEQLRKHLQSLIDQTTPLEPEPGNPMWSRRIRLDEVIAERDQLRAECENLRREVGGLRASRIAYASEFPANADGNPDTGRIHENIRKLKDECDSLRDKTSMSIGVGDGTGNLYVHGDYDSIKRVQALIFEREILVKALELISDTDPDEETAWFHDIAHKALAVHRK